MNTTTLEARDPYPLESHASEFYRVDLLSKHIHVIHTGPLMEMRPNKEKLSITLFVELKLIRRTPSFTSIPEKQQLCVVQIDEAQF